MRTLLSSVLATLASVVLLPSLISCGPKEVPIVQVIGDVEKTVPASGATVEIDVQYTVDYSVEVESSARSWIHYVETRAVQSGKLVFIVDANEGAERSGKVTLKDKSGAVPPVTITITQEAKPEDPVVIDVESVVLDAENAEIEIGGALQLSATVFPENATDKTVTWGSDNEAVATVSASGLVAGISAGEATITAKAGEKSAACKVTVNPDAEDIIKTALMQIYDAMDGPNWTITGKWDLSKPLSTWEGVVWKPKTNDLSLYFNGEFGLKGEIPDCFGDLSQLQTIYIQNEPGVTGTLPPSFNTLKRIKGLSLYKTSMTSIPDFFEGMPLEDVVINSNTLMTGTLPESLGHCLELHHLSVGDNAFTGTVPDSWALLGTGLDLLEGSLDEKVPDSFVSSPYADYLVNMYISTTLFRTAPVVVGDYDIPAFWPQRDIKDIVTGETIPYKEIVSRNKATILLNWATWCPFSKTLMPVLKRMYDKYHGNGLEIIAAYNADSRTLDMGRPLKDILLERNYDDWYNFNLWDFSGTEWNMWCSDTPSAIVVDNNGNIMASSRTKVSDPARDRFGYTASTSLIPLLEEVFGPLEEENDYSSSDYSRDGEVMTIQTASVGKGINVVFMGDAYTDRDMNAGGLYETLMHESVEEFFDIEPFKTFRNRFNVYAVKVVSKNGRTGDGCSTALGTVATYGSISTGNIDKCFEYALKVPGIKDDKNLLIGVLVNSVSGRGITMMSESRQSGVAFYGSGGNDHTAFGGVLRHEAGGHGFAFLDDEYETMSGAATKEHIEYRNSMYQKYGWYSNVDFTDDPSKVKWNVFLSDDRYKDEVGIFEGGSLYSKGAYRPSENSLMRDIYEYFNAPSRWAIYKRIMELSGNTASFDKFLEYDAVNRNAAKSPASDAAPRSGLEHNAPPVIVP